LTGASGATGPAGVPCAGCVNDTSLATTTFRISGYNCWPEINAAGQPALGTANLIGWVFDPEFTEALRCQIVRPPQALPDTQLTVDITFSFPGVAAGTPDTIQFGVTPQVYALPTSPGTSASAFATATAAQFPTIGHAVVTFPNSNTFWGASGNGIGAVIRVFNNTVVANQRQMVVHQIDIEYLGTR
jgi:hypothetical protein